MKQKELVGQLLYGSYRVTRLMDEGGMGVLYEAQHETQPQRKVVIKVFDPDVVKDATAFARARLEAEVISATHQPHITRILGFDELKTGVPYMVLELLQGENLGARIQRKRMSPGAVVRMLGQVGGALKAAHDHDIFHRDLRPAYLFLVPGGADGPQVKLLNIGVSRLRDPRTPRRSRGAFSRAYFSSPEQLDEKRRELGRTTDIFSLGCICYLALAGEVPFPARSLAKYLDRVKSQEPEPISEKVPGLSREVDAVLGRALARDPADRFQRMEEFVDELTRVMERKPEEQRPEKQPEQPAPAPAREPEPPHGLTPRQAAALPRVVPGAEAPPPVNLSRVARSLPPSVEQPFEDHSTVLMEDDELPPQVTPPARPAHDSANQLPLRDASFFARKTAVAPPMQADVNEGKDEEEEPIMLRDVSESEEDATTTNLMGVDELECEEEVVTDLIPLGELLAEADAEDEDEDATVIAIDLQDVEEVSTAEVTTDFKDTKISPTARQEVEDFFEATTTRYKKSPVSPRTEFSDGVRLRDVSQEVDEEAETEIHDMTRPRDED